MPITTAVDGSTLVNAALLNSYKQGIEDLESGAVKAGSLNIGGLTEETSVDLDADSVALHDASGNVIRRVKVKRLHPITTKGDLTAGGASGALTRLPVGTNGYVLTADSAEVTGMKWAEGGGGMTKIAEFSGAAASYSFTSIPQGYKHLLIRYSARSDDANPAVSMLMRFNNDTGPNYATCTLSNSNTTVSGASDNSASYMDIGVIAGAGSDAGAMGTGSVNINDYTDSAVWAGMQGMGHCPTGGGGGPYTGIYSGNWENVAAVTRIDLYPSSGAFVSGSVATLYGLA